MNCPTKLLNLRAQDINPAYFYSYWITIYFFIYTCIFWLLKYYKQSGFIEWLNPYPTVIVGTIVQLIIFILGIGTMPLYFVVGVAIWKICLLMAAILLLPVDWSLPTIIFNLLVIGIYCVYLVMWLNINPVELYLCITSNPNYYPPSLRDFISIRFG